MNSNDTVTVVAKAASDKTILYKKNPIGFLIKAALAGMYVGISVILSTTVGVALPVSEVYGTSIVQGLSFGVGMSLVVMAGGELFTGNNMIMTVGIMQKTVNLGNTLRLGAVNLFGNLLGAVLLTVMFVLSGLTDGTLGEYIIEVAYTKMSLSPVELIFRGALCNFLVCAAVWCSWRMSSESGKILVILMCLFAFVTSGFEHSIANMLTFASATLISADVNVLLGGLYNLFFVIIGNMLGGILLVAIPNVISRQQ